VVVAIKICACVKMQINTRKSEFTTVIKKKKMTGFTFRERHFYTCPALTQLDPI
jgi:hypothetical protein